MNKAEFDQEAIKASKAMIELFGDEAYDYTYKPLKQAHNARIGQDSSNKARIAPEQHSHTENTGQTAGKLGKLDP